MGVGAFREPLPTGTDDGKALEEWRRGWQTDGRGEGGGLGGGEGEGE